MKTYEEYLQKFIPNIREGYEAWRMDNKIADFNREQEKPIRRLLKYSEPIRAQAITPDGRLPFPSSPRIEFREVTPFNAGFFIPMNDWAENPTRFGGMDSFMYDIGKIVAEREYYHIIKSMVSCDGHEFEMEEELTKEFILDIQKRIRDPNIYYDCIVMHPSLTHEFIKRGEIFPEWNLPDVYWTKTQKVRFFEGLLDGLKVYWAHFMNNRAVIFSSRYIQVINTPIKIHWDVPDKPTALVIERMCSSSPKLDNAIVKIKYNID